MFDSGEISADRIVVTGIGVCSPAGNGQRDFWDGLLRGRSHQTPPPWARVESMRCRSVCRVPRRTKATAPDSSFDTGQIAVDACQEALSDAGIAPAVSRMRVGIVVGTAMGGFDTGVNYGAARVPELALINSPAHLLARAFFLTGPVSAVPAACAAGSVAIVYAMLQLQQHRADAMLQVGLTQFQMYLSQDSPACICSPTTVSDRLIEVEPAFSSEKGPAFWFLKLWRLLVNEKLKSTRRSGALV